MTSKENSSRMAVIPPEETGGRPVKVWATRYDEHLQRYVPDLEPQTVLQVAQVARLPCVEGHVSLMADAHFGMGVPIGCVLPTKGAIIPNAVGSDIGCGMCAWNSGVPIEDLNQRELMKELKELIPHGEGKAHSVRSQVLSEPKLAKKIDELADRHDQMESEFGKFNAPPKFSNFESQMGTLGGGNHFVELQVDSSDLAWIMIHSGSRGYGSQTARIHHDAARAICSKYFSRLEIDALAYLPDDSNEGRYYICAMRIAQDWALLNRLTMMRAAQRAIRNQQHGSGSLDNIINIHHNYADLENHGGKNVWVHRKGATLARVDTIGIIPGSMTTKSFIVKGKGNKDSLNSCSHGSGRRFSRREAKRRIHEGEDPSQDSQLKAANVELYGTRDAKDELGSAYKDVDEVMQNQADLVEIVTELRPVAVLKG